MNPIFARKVTILEKNGSRKDYTHVTEFNVVAFSDGQHLLISGETDDVYGTRINIFDRIPIKDLHMTIIDWYIPSE